MQKTSYYFTFGRDKRYPFQDGWVEIVAESLNQAIEVFKVYCPNREEGILNCADFYTEAQFDRTGIPKKETSEHSATERLEMWNNEPKNKERR